MELFTYQNGKAMPSVHALIIEPYKTIWAQDKDPTKGEAVRFFTFIELACSPKKSNPYFGYGPEERYQILKEKLFGEKAYQLPGLVMDGLIQYEDFLTHASPSYSLLKAALDGAEQFKTYLSNINLSERTNSGTAVYKPRDVTNALKDLPSIAKNIEELRIKVQQELLEEGKTRSNREVGLFEE
jgi:hypothetical protein